MFDGANIGIVLIPAKFLKAYSTKYLFYCTNCFLQYGQQPFCSKMSYGWLPI